eukprot:6206531-Pleurochrysis_carterae.AAC.4
MQKWAQAVLLRRLGSDNWTPSIRVCAHLRMQSGNQERSNLCGKVRTHAKALLNTLPGTNCSQTPGRSDLSNFRRSHTPERFRRSCQPSFACTRNRLPPIDSGALISTGSMVRLPARTCNLPPTSSAMRCTRMG